MKASELRKKTLGELQSERVALLKEQFNLRMQRVGEQAPQTHLFKKVRKSIARINTILNEIKGS